MAFHPVMSNYPFKVVATDAKRPGWSFIWGGYQSEADAKDGAERFKAQGGTQHLTFVIRNDDCRTSGRFGSEL